jgi:hypothetical protein
LPFIITVSSPTLTPLLRSLPIRQGESKGTGNGIGSLGGVMRVLDGFLNSSGGSGIHWRFMARGIRGHKAEGRELRLPFCRASESGPMARRYHETAQIQLCLETRSDAVPDQSPSCRCLFGYAPSLMDFYASVSWCPVSTLP